jgi:hypothetical protein
MTGTRQSMNGERGNLLTGFSEDCGKDSAQIRFAPFWRAIREENISLRLSIVAAILVQCDAS